MNCFCVVFAGRTMFGPSELGYRLGCYHYEYRTEPLRGFPADRQLEREFPKSSPGNHPGVTA